MMGYTQKGVNLEIGLSSGNTERVATEPSLTGLYLGGLGNAKLLWDKVPAHTEPFSPGNLLTFWHRAPLRHACCRRQPHRRYDVLSSDAADG